MEHQIKNLIEEVTKIQDKVLPTLRASNKTPIIYSMQIKIIRLNQLLKKPPRDEKTIKLMETEMLETKKYFINIGLTL